jgi:hypothetical protein
MSRLLFDFFDRYSTLTRDGTFVVPSTDWTRATWTFLDVASIVAGEDFTVWELRSADTRTAARLFTSLVASVLTLQLEARLNGVIVASVSTPFEAESWFMVTPRYTASTHTLDVYLDDALAVTGTMDLSAFPVLAVDSLLQGTLPSEITIRGCRDRWWQQALSETAIGFEFESTRAVVQNALLADTPLTGPADLSDASGNGHNWTLAGTAFGVAGPGPAIGGVA